MYKPEKYEFSPVNEHSNQVITRIEFAKLFFAYTQDAFISNRGAESQT